MFGDYGSYDRGQEDETKLRSLEDRRCYVSHMTKTTVTITANAPLDSLISKIRLSSDHKGSLNHCRPQSYR